MTSILYRLSLRFVLTIVGLIFLGSTPALFKGTSLNLKGYWGSIESVLKQLIHFNHVTFTEYNAMKQNHYLLLPRLFNVGSFSIEIFILSFFLAFLIALLLTYITVLLPPIVIKIIKFILFLLESLPDLLVISIFQLFVIWVYTKTHILIVNIVAYGEHKVILLPVLVLTLLPTIMLYRLMILDFEEEENQNYVELAKGKGIGMSIIFLRHILRNAMIHIFIDSKYVLWFMLSNLLIVEVVFNIDGLLHFIRMHPFPIIISAGLIMMFIPIFIILAIGNIIIEKVVGHKVEV